MIQYDDEGLMTPPASPGLQRTTFWTCKRNNFNELIIFEFEVMTSTCRLTGCALCQPSCVKDNCIRPVKCNTHEIEVLKFWTLWQDSSKFLCIIVYI